jgi:hypothetical protein
MRRSSLVLPCLLLAALAAFPKSTTAHHGAPISGLLPTDAVSSSEAVSVPVSAAAAVTAAADDEPVTCPTGLEPGNPDWGKGKTSQGVSYAVPMLQVSAHVCCRAAGPYRRSSVLECHVMFSIFRNELLVTTLHCLLQRDAAASLQGALHSYRPCIKCKQ